MDRGSEWRRWELHLHTPGTKKNDNYIGDTDKEKWDNFYKDIENYIGDGSDPLHSICAVAITDYLSIDNYLKVCEDKRFPDCIKLVLPNVELRMVPIASDSPINIHCIFDPDIVDQLENRFFGNLVLDNPSGYPYKATKKDIIQLGRDFTSDQSLPEQKAYKEGINQFVISYDSLSNLFKHDPQLRAKTIIAVSNNSNDGASGLKEHNSYFVGNVSQLGYTRRSIYKLTDAVFSPSENDIKYFLGKGVDSPDDVIEKCGSLKPCIHGSDAHSNEDIFRPDNDRYCWIKADPTFEGLKQIIYEPEGRVRISSTIPETKPDYDVIDHVFIEGNKDFSSNPIYFNDKLNCIIGGKSTGKTLLLHNIAEQIDAEQVKGKNEVAPTNVKRISGLKVFWRDGACSTDTNLSRKIVYIPQSYLIKLSDDEQETTDIDDIIQDVILQNENCHKAYNLLKEEVASKKQELSAIIVDTIKRVNDITHLNEQCKNVGDKDAIESDIIKLNSEFEKLSKECNITDEDVAKYQFATGKVQSLEDQMVIIESEIESLSKLDTIIEIKSSINTEIVVLKDSFSKAIQKVKKVVDEAWITQREIIIKDANKQKEEIEASIKENTEIINELQPRISENEQMSKLSADVANEKGKLIQINDYMSDMQQTKEKLSANIDTLSQTFKEFREIYNKYIDCINYEFNQPSSGLDFSAELVLCSDKLSDKFIDILNNKTFSHFDKIDFDNVSDESVTPDNMAAFLKSILENSNESLQLKKSYSKESAMREIFDDWYKIAYIVKMDGDSIKEMSPGKKSLVLLKLLISMQDSTCPILIDQPEDDLDNRSIYDELICFIKEKKVDRQIITVTHNANIVLGGDAELVIVANQEGSNCHNEGYLFEYRGGAIENNMPVLDDNGNPVPGVLNSKGIQEQICEILEGGEKAFSLRQNKYHIS